MSGSQTNPSSSSSSTIESESAPVRRSMRCRDAHRISEGGEPLAADGSATPCCEVSARSSSSRVRSEPARPVAGRALGLYVLTLSWLGEGGAGEGGGTSQAATAARQKCAGAAGKRTRGCAVRHCRPEAAGMPSSTHTPATPRIVRRRSDERRKRARGFRQRGTRRAIDERPPYFDQRNCRVGLLVVVGGVC